MTTQKRVTLAAVAQAAGVDLSLVSRVLRGQTAGERAETRDRIVYHANRLGYRPNAIARSLRTARAGAYGLVVPDFTNPVYGAIISGAETAAAKRNCVILAGSGRGWETGEWYDALSSGRVDGLLVLGGGADLDISSLNVPYLFVNRGHPHSNRSLTMADAEAAGMAVNHLLELGHTQIAHIGGSIKADTAQRRLSGYIEALERSGITRDPKLTAFGDYTSAGGAKAMATLIKRGVPFSAIVAANVTSAIGAISTLQDAGFSVPADVSVVAIHDADVASYFSPHLTTVKMPLEKLGARAIELLADKDPDEEIKEVVKGPMKLIQRQSTQRAGAS